VTKIYKSHLSTQ